jgi:hypothetical protein
LTGEELYAALIEISKARFDGRIAIEKGYEGWGPGGCAIRIFPDHAHPIWLAEPQKIEIRHGGRGSLDWWIESCFINDLAVKLDGVISDDGVEETWRGEPGKYPTFRAYRRRGMTSRVADLCARVSMAFELREARQSRPDLRKWL